jgi:hypothetical protein
MFAARLDNVEIDKVPCQIAYWFCKDGPRRVLLVAFVPEERIGREELGYLVEYEITFI